MSLQSAEQNRRQVWLNRFWSMWPQAPIGAAVILAGVLNIVDGLRYPAVDLAGLEPLLKLDDSLWTLAACNIHPFCCCDNWGAG